jgi:hypothetical protein
MMMNIGSHFMYSMILGKVLNVMFNFIRKLHKKKAVQVIIAILLYFVCLNIVFRISNTESEHNLLSEYGLSIFSSPKELKKQFRTISKTLHPDRNPDNMELYMKLVSLYDTLLDPEARFIYDRFGIMTGGASAETVTHIFQGIIHTYSSVLMFIPFLLFNLFSPFKFKVVYGFMLILLALFTYMIFLKQPWDPLTLLFPRMMTFQIIEILTSGIMYQIVFITRLISFASESKIVRHKKMLQEVTKFYKEYKESLRESVNDLQEKITEKMKIKRKKKEDESIQAK